jgi:hypothetical protein
MPHHTARYRPRTRQPEAEEYGEVLEKFALCLERQDRFQRHLNLLRLVVSKKATKEQAREFVDNWVRYLAIREVMETWPVDGANYVKVAYNGSHSWEELIVQYRLFSRSSDVVQYIRQAVGPA